MPITIQPQEDGQAIKVFLQGPWKGMNTESPPMSIPEGFLPAGQQNYNLPAGTPERVDGHAIHAVGFDTGSSTPNLLARYIPSSGAASYVTADESGQVYSHASAGGAPTIIRRGLSTTTGLWWSHTQLADYLIIANPTDGNFKWDGTRLLPLGAKYILDMESDESGWTGGTVDTTTVREGTQARSLTAVAGGTADMDNQPATAKDLIDGLLQAVDYNTTTDRISFFVNLDVAANLDTTNSYIRFGNVADTAYFQAAATTWGTLVNGWNLVRIARSAFTTTGAPNWNSIAKISFHIDANAASTVTAIFDDTYVYYRAVAVMPAVQIVANWKNIVFGAQTTADPSNLYFSETAAPDEFDELAVILVDTDDGASITTLHPYYNQVLIGKENSVHSLSGTVAGTIYPNFNFELLRITVEHGASSHRATVEANRDVYMWWRGGIYMYNGTGTRKLSTRIDPTLATVNMARLTQIVGARYRVLNQIRWYHPDGTDTQNADGIVYDYEHDAFIPVQQQTMVLAEQVFQDATEYLLTVQYDGEVQRQDSGTDFDGTAIVGTVTYPWLAAQLPNELKMWNEVYIPHQTNTGTLTVQYRVADHPRELDAASFVTAGSITMNAEGELGRVFIGERGVWLQLRLTTTGAAFTLWDPIVVLATRLGARF